ncbi:MAG: nitrous oxide reductase accessory protein NosL [Pseudomonas sp.]
MMKMQGITLRWCLLAFVSLFLTACSEDKKATEVTEVVGPVAFESGDECHVCGMIITELPVAKSHSVESRIKAVRKFCSTQDMLSWWLQPENQHLQAELYVHDVAKTPWEHPQDEHLIDARTAFYVLGSSVQGAMGPSLVSFGTREAAELFADTKGGRVLSWQQMDLAVLQELASAGHEHAAAHGEQLQHEHGVTVEADEHSQHNADQEQAGEALTAPVDAPAADTAIDHDAHSGH